MEAANAGKHGQHQDEALRDFRNFLFFVWKHLNLPDPTWVQYDIAQFLQHGPSRRLIEAFRGVGKSWITSAYALWLLYWNPAHNILVVSASKDRADAFSTFTLRLIHEIPELNWLAPRSDQRQSMVAFDVGPAPPAHAPSIKSVGIFGQMTGSRADTIIADDVEVLNNSDTQLKRDRLHEVIKEFDAILKPEPSSEIIYLMTPQTEDSIANVLPERGYTARIWPARYPTEEQSSAYGDRLAPLFVEALERDPSLEGKPTDPDRFDDEDLLSRELSYGRSGFALQFMLDTSLSDENRYPLKCSDLVVMDLDLEVGPERVVWGSGTDQVLKDLPCVGMRKDRYHAPLRLQGDFVPWNGMLMAIDPAGTGSDETAYAVLSCLNGNVFLHELGGFADGHSPPTLGKLAAIAKRYRVTNVVVEANFGDGMWTKLFKPVLHRAHPCSIEEVKHSTQKERRIINTLEPVMNQHRLIVSQTVILADNVLREGMAYEQAKRYQLFHQLTRITTERGALTHDDRLDALAIGVNWWTDRLDVTDMDMVRKRRSDLMDEELERFLEHAGGRPQAPDGWYQTAGFNLGTRRGA